MMKVAKASLVVGLLLVVAAGSSAQNSLPPLVGSWAAVESLTARDDLRVELCGGEVLRGTFRRASESALALAHKGVETAFLRADIRRVYRLVPRPRRHHVLAGAIIGGALGVFAGLIGDTPSNTNRGAVVATAVAFDAGLGALIGYGVSGRGEHLLVYQAAPQPGISGRSRGSGSGAPEGASGNPPL